ncbi:MAG: acyl-homoserine-lactone synthase [Rhodospirillaceae bacterium]
MIDCFSWADAHAFGDALAEHYRLRHRVFVQDLNWRDMTTVNGMEWDRYDRPDSWYLVARDTSGAMVGTLRLLPTTGAYMIKDLWPERIDGGPPSSPTVWEGSRFCTAPGLPVRQSQHVASLILAGAVAFGARFGIETILAVTTPSVVRGVFDRSGLRSHPAGPTWQVEGQTVMVNATRTRPEDYAVIKARLNLPADPLVFSAPAARVIAA